MTSQTERELLEKLDELRKELYEIKVVFATYTSSKDSCMQKCAEVYGEVMGDRDHVGIKSKMWVVWSGLGTAWAAIVVIAGALAKQWMDR